MNQPATYALTMFMGLSGSVTAPAVVAAHALSSTQLDAITVNRSRTTTRDAADAYSAIKTRWTDAGTLADKQSNERQVAGAVATFGDNDTPKRRASQGAHLSSATQTLASTSSGAAVGAAPASQTAQSTEVPSTQTPNASTGSSSPAGSEGGATQGAGAPSAQSPPSVPSRFPTTRQFPSAPSSIPASRQIGVGNRARSLLNGRP